MSTKTQRLGALVVFALLAGCSQERPVRSFAQPNILRKADMAGTWYYVQTVMDAPPSNGVMFTGLASELLKGKFDIQEGYLYFRRSYEQIGGTEDMRQYDPRGYYGMPVAAWKITSQFDLIRDYSAVTGEQTNKIIESQERPWEQREFIRVDWSQNLVTDYVGIGVNLFFDKSSGVSVEPVSYWEADPTQPDGIYKEFQDPPADAQGNPLTGDALAKATAAMDFQPSDMTYFDVTNKIVLTPQQLTLNITDETGNASLTYPKCFLSYEVDDCASQVIKLRHAFAKISPKHDYVPRQWDGIQMQRFGIWDVGLNRLTYNRDYGITNTGFVRTAARFNLWKQSYPQNPDGSLQLTACSDDSDCADGQICGNYYQDGNPPQMVRVCQIHPKARELRTIPYYAESSLHQRRAGKAGEYDVDLFGGAGGPGQDPSQYDLFDVGAQVIGQWNDAFKAAYTDATKERTADQLLDPGNTGMPAPHDIFVWCHNPVKLQADAAGPADPAACLQGLTSLKTFDQSGNLIDVLDEKGQKVYRPRQGDPRRSTIFWVNEMQASGPLGYGPGLYDPETGETISGQAYIYGAALDTYAVRSRDLMLLMINQINTNDYVKGVNVANFVNSNRGGVGSRNATYFTRQDLLSRAMGMNFDWAIGAAPEAKLDPTSVTSFWNTFNARDARMYASGAFGTGDGDPAADRKLHLQDTAIESMLVPADQLQGLATSLGGVVKWDALTADEKARLSPLRSGAVQDAIQQRMDMMSTFAVDFADFFDEGIYQRVLAAKQNPDLVDTTNTRCNDGQGNKACYDAEKLRVYLRRAIFLGVTLHEMGHNVGLRHNFRASYDAMNYFPQYWTLRDQGRSASKDCLGNAWDAPAAGDPNEGKLRPRYVHRPGGATSDVECKGGVREYQYSSIMDYGAEFNSDLHGLGSYDKAAIKYSYAEYLEAFTDVDQNQLDNWSALQNASQSYGLPSPLAPVVGLAAIPYTSYPGLFANGIQSIAKRVDVPAALAVNANGQNNPVYAVRHAGKTYPIVPYYFCSDEFVGNLTCQRFDAGADAFEQAQDLAARYDEFYLVNNFKRDRYAFWASAAYLGRIRSRYFDMLREQMTWYVLLRGEFEDYLVTLAELSITDPNQARQQAASFFADENQWGSFTAGVTLGFDALGDAVTRPNYGSYIPVASADSDAYPGDYYRSYQDMGFGDTRNLPLGVGKYQDTTWDFTGCGYYWYDQCTSRIGYFMDKRLALDELTQSQAYFTGRDTSTDVRKYAIGYYRLFPAQLADKLGALLAGDFAGYAPRFNGPVPGDGQGNYQLARRRWSTGLFDQPEPPLGETVEPGTGFTLQVETGADFLASVSGAWDRDAIENTQICIVGNGEAPVDDSLLWNPATGHAGPQATESPISDAVNGGQAACDPVALAADQFQACVAAHRPWFVYHASNERIYAARSTPRARSTQMTGVPATALRQDTGARMLEMLRTLDQRYQANLARPLNDPDRDRLVAVSQTAFQNFVANIEVMRSLHKAYGYGQYKNDAPFVY